MVIRYFGPTDTSGTYIYDGVIQLYYVGSMNKISILAWCNPNSMPRTFTIPEGVMRSDGKLIFSMDVFNSTMFFRVNGREVHRLSQEDGGVCWERIKMHHDVAGMFIQSSDTAEYRQVHFHDSSPPSGSLQRR
eukprot:sb/3474889/